MRVYNLINKTKNQVPEFDNSLQRTIYSLIQLQPLSVNQLAEKISGKVLVVEPHIQTLPAVLSQHKNVALTNLEDALSSADIIVLLVAHTVFTAEKLTASHAIIIDVVGVIKRKHAANFAIA